MNIPRREMLLEPWLPAAGIAMTYSTRGIGMTFLALSVAHAVAAGGTVLGWRAPGPAPVLYLDGEMPLAALQSRLAGIVAGADAEMREAGNLRFLPADHYRDGLPDLATEEGFALLETCLGNAKLVILDNLSTLTGIRENEADDWAPMQANLLALRRRGVSTLLVHHAGKGGAQRGTSRKEDALDTVIALRRPDDYDAADGARFTVNFEKARGFMGADAAAFEARMRITPETKAVTWERADIAADQRAAAMEAFGQGKTAMDVGKEFGVSRATAYRWQKDWRAGGAG